MASFSSLSLDGCLSLVAELGLVVAIVVIAAFVVITIACFLELSLDTRPVVPRVSFLERAIELALGCQRISTDILLGLLPVRRRALEKHPL